MNNIIKLPVNSLGYNFIKKEYLPKGKDEYYLRNLQNRNGAEYRNLTAFEIEALVRNRNTSDNWNNIWVSDLFNPELVKNCKFYGLVRIGKLEPYMLVFSDLKVAVGLYDSTIISCDIGDNSVINNVHYLSHYIIGEEVILTNINEMQTTEKSKFGNGIVKDGENENIRIWLELSNENGGRKILPFNGMLAGDAWLWSKYRDDKKLLDRFIEFTEAEFKTARGFYGKVGDRTVIKNTDIIKDVWIGSDAYIKGANKLKNLTINSGEEGHTQIGEGCELVNGSIGFGNRIFYGVKAVRFVTASHVQLKYGARLINSYLGNNSTISCCEVLNSLIFPAHEQHHNNSFLCAATVFGQSNIPAGATIGSNHNSRGADGEILAGRGFWPALCTSLKHNSKFASYTMLAKGDYNYELNIPIPFSLISLDVQKNNLVVMPAYWFMYNMYALTRNTWKYFDRDKRKEKIQHIEYDFLAPDTVNEMFEALRLLEIYTGKAFYFSLNKNYLSNEEHQKIGREILNDEASNIEDINITAEGFENSKRETKIIKVKKSYRIFKQMIVLYGLEQLVNFILTNKISSVKQLKELLPKDAQRNNWLNVGGQLIPEENVSSIRKNIYEKKINSWNDLHQHYQAEGEKYTNEKLKHALASLEEIKQIHLNSINKKILFELFDELLLLNKQVLENIKISRKKDYTNAFRKMMYSSQTEMDSVLGKFSDNSFIRQQEENFKNFSTQIQASKSLFKN
ncbi:DUF4954 domain-containing protein [Arachidicoccus ginsenosidimutans]|uniref:DUF4954 family protein n=1 Tax=Arachidicoccus sp. BS20 TaxID=1850526 RepID=UPI0007F0847A|nr:DUF4954 family protein [Arachidicoccus sp. BS20]ANI88667.1 DUF4954 domain-containing protein [Arachidicoccus sp. BS20]